MASPAPILGLFSITFLYTADLRRALTGPLVLWLYIVMKSLLVHDHEMQNNSVISQHAASKLHNTSVIDAEIR